MLTRHSVFAARRPAGTPPLISASALVLAGVLLASSTAHAGLITIKENDVSLVNVNFNFNLFLTSATPGGEQTPFNVTFQENIDFFTLHVASSPAVDFDDDGAKRWDLTFGDLWPITMQLFFEDVGGLFGDNPDQFQLNDLVAHHRVSHDRTEGEGPLYKTSSPRVEAIKQKKPSYEQKLPFTCPQHSMHFDCYFNGQFRATLNQNTGAVSGLFVDLEGGHSPTPREDPTPVPEPGTLVLMVTGVTALLYRRGRRFGR